MKRYYTMNDRLDFGKYHGQLISTVIRDDPEYLDWCLENIEDFKLDEEADAALEWELYG